MIGIQMLTFIKCISYDTWERLWLHNVSFTLAQFLVVLGWSGGAMALGKLPVSGRPTNLDLQWVRVGDIFWTFLLSSIISLFFLPLSGRRPEIY